MRKTSAIVIYIFRRLTLKTTGRPRLSKPVTRRGQRGVDALWCSTFDGLPHHYVALESYRVRPTRKSSGNGDSHERCVAGPTKAATRTMKARLRGNPSTIALNVASELAENLNSNKRLSHPETAANAASSDSTTTCTSTSATLITSRKSNSLAFPRYLTKMFLARTTMLRLYFFSFAYVLVETVRRLGLKGTEHARAQRSAIRVKLFKVAATVRVSAHRV